MIKKSAIVLILCSFLFLVSCKQKNVCEQKGHDYIVVCNNDGTHSLTCSRDSSHIKIEECLFSEWNIVVEAQLFEEGKEERTCNKCSYKEERIISCTHKHEYTEEWIIDKEATCLEAGYKKYETCSRCSYSTYEEIKALGHDKVIHEEKSATCLEAGHKKYETCSRCSYSTYEEIEALGHIYDNYICINCEQNYFETILVFKLSSNKTYYDVIGCIDSSSEIIIPSTYNDLPVAGIGESAFENCSSLISVIIQEGITTIGKSAFYGCGLLESIIIPNSITSIKDKAFYECSSLISIIIPEGVTEIGYNTFSYCTSLEYIEIPDSAIKTIRSNILNGCVSLKKIRMPLSKYYGFTELFSNEPYLEDQRKYVPFRLKEVVITSGEVNGDFATCSNLETIRILKDVSVSKSSFKGCTSLKTLQIMDTYMSCLGNYFAGYDDIVYPEDNAKYVPQSLKEVIIGWTVIEESYFENCKYIENVKILEGVQIIGDFAFYGCSSLKEVEIGDTVKSIGVCAFGSCTSLLNLTLSKNLTGFGSSAFSYCTSLSNVYYSGTIEKWCNITMGDEDSNPMYCASNFYMLDENNNWYELIEIKISNNITEINDYTFYGFNHVISVILPNSVTKIGSSAFRNCTALENIEIPESVTSIGGGAFYNCSSLTSINIPENVSKIGDWTFKNCTSLVNVIISKNVREIGKSAFANCSSLTSIVIPYSVSVIGGGAFYDCGNLTICCEISKKPSNWDTNWSDDNCLVLWGYTE